jgi:hypothetical protein
MMKRVGLAAVAILAASVGGIVDARPMHSRSPCIDVRNERQPITLSGRLTLRSFPGSPNYESIAKGDEKERVFILQLPKRICLTDGGQFGDPRTKFVEVHVSSDRDEMIPVLRAGVGRRVRVTGTGFAAFDGHHHAPLVLMAQRVVAQ